MKLSIGIIGLPNAGKSTLFNALVKRQLAKVAEYPFTTIEPHEGVIEVPDERLTALGMMIKPEKVTPATITFIDIAGLVKGAHKGEGLGNEFLSHIRSVDAILHVVRAFESSQAVHTMGTVDPERDIEIINTELLLKDLDTTIKILEREKEPHIKVLFTKIKEAINRGKPVRELEFSDEEKHHVDAIEFLTAKPIFFCLNISEQELSSPRIKELEEKDFLIVCAKMEADLMDLSEEEQEEYRKLTGVTVSSFEKIIKEAYSILDLITFFTIKGGKEVKAWLVKKGNTAIHAADMVHTDMAKGFIKAEVISFDLLKGIGDWQKAHESGNIRLEGRDYQINDADVVEFKFKS